MLKAGGQIVPDGALVHVTTASYLFKTKFTIEGTSKKSAKEEEVECEAESFEQGKIRRDLAANAWHVIETQGIDFCEGEVWFGGHAMTHPLTFSGPNVVSDESGVQLFRTEEQIKTEEKQQFEHEEPLRAREPTRCVYNTISSKGRFHQKKPKKRKGQPPGPVEGLVAKATGKMALSPSSSLGCGATAKWKASFTLTYKGLPVVAAFEPAPTVSGVSPAEGPEPGGTSVVISGTGFTGASAVQFGSTNATSFKVNSNSSITAVAPSGGGSVDVTVTTPVTRTATRAADTFTYAQRPTVTEVTPKGGPESGGTSVTITGTNFTSGSTVHFGSTPASSVKVNSAGSITAVSPAGSGTLNVIVTNAGGTSAVSSADKFSYVPPPTVSEVTPKTGPESGGTSVTITGSNFHEVSAVKFGSTSATKFKVNSETSIEAESPAGSGTVHVTVITAGGTSATGSADEFTY